MRFYVRHWYSINLIFIPLAVIYLVIRWNDSTMIEKLLVANFIALLLHQFEEYGFPGGEPMIMNCALADSPTPDRFPLNQLSGMITNDAVLFITYALPIFFPDVIWLAIPPMLMGLGQFVVHGILTNIKMHSIYNPGLIAVLFLHVPIGIFFIWYVCANGLATGWEWLFGILLTIVETGFLVAFCTYVLFATRKSKWPFAPVELERFHVKERLQKRGIVMDAQGGIFNKLPIGKLQKKLHHES